MFEFKTAVAYVLLFAGCTLFAMVAGLLSSWIDRKVTALVQARVGPPLLQPFWDFIKLLGKETLVPAGANRAAFMLMPLVALASVALSATILLGNVLWQNGLLPPYGFVGDLVVVLYLLIVPSAALVIGGSSSNNPYASVGASREIKLMSYELPLLLSVAAALTLASAGEQRFTRELQEQVNSEVKRGSALYAEAGSRGAVRASVPLRFRDILILRDAGPEPAEKLLAERGRAKVNAACAVQERSLREGQGQGAARARAGALYDEGRRVSRLLVPPDLAAAARGSAMYSSAGLLALALCVIVVFACAQAKLGLVPFDCAEADTEIAGGVLIEYGGPLLGVWKLTKAMLLFTLPVFIGVVFMGGFRFFAPGGGVGANVGQIAVSLLKYVLILVFFVLVRNTNPRVRIDQAMRFFLGPMSLLALVALILAVVVHWGSML